MMGQRKENNIKIKVSKIGCVDVNWIEMVKNYLQW
jgi:hypothetical protein